MKDFNRKIQHLSGVMHVTNLDGSDPVVLDHSLNLPEGCLVRSEDLGEITKALRDVGDSTNFAFEPRDIVRFKSQELMEVQWQHLVLGEWQNCTVQFQERFSGEFRQVLIRKEQGHPQCPKCDNWYDNEKCYGCGYGLSEQEAKKTFNKEQEPEEKPKCEWCNDVGLIGNILDTRTCHYCQPNPQPEEVRSEVEFIRERMVLAFCKTPHDAFGRDTKIQRYHNGMGDMLVHFENARLDYASQFKKP